MPDEFRARLKYLRWVFLLPVGTGRVADAWQDHADMTEPGLLPRDSRPAGRHCPSIDSLPLARAARRLARISTIEGRKRPQAARRSDRGVPQAGFAAGSFPAPVRWWTPHPPVLPGGVQSLPRRYLSLARGHDVRQASKGKPLKTCREAPRRANNRRLPPTQRSAPRIGLGCWLRESGFPHRGPLPLRRSPHGTGRA
jgi:hypothetical protein